MSEMIKYCVEHGVRPSDCIGAYRKSLERPGLIPEKSVFIFPEPEKRPPPVVPSEMQAERADKCRSCPRYDKEADKCRICGCGAIIRQRSSSPFATCPEGRWPRLPLPDFT
jgi:hypothetical protein